jgi:pimeloyl-ACP methyl ester carboxylesterase
LVHGGRDHCRSWDAVARALQPHFHVLAPDLRGHGDSDWAKGGSYSLTEYVYDLSRLVRSVTTERVTIVGHSMGGMVGLIYSGTFPDQVSALVVLDGVTVLPGAKTLPANERIAKWIGQLDKLAEREPRRYRTIEEAAAQMRAHNARLPGELAHHLATYGVRQNEDGTYSWKFDPCQRAMAPHRLSADDHMSLWSRITCPTLLLQAEDSFLASSRIGSLASYFPQAHVERISGAGHWLHHDKPDEVLRAIRTFLGLSEDKV